MTSLRSRYIGQSKWHHQIPLPHKHRSRGQYRHPKCHSSQAMVKDVFLHNGGQCNTFAHVSCLNHSRRFFYLPPVFEKRREVLFWVPSPYPPSPPSPRMFCLKSRLLLKLAFLNLACAIYAKTILLKCFQIFFKF